MKTDYINIYNKLISLTRNKNLYQDFKDQDNFSDRLMLFLFHFAFFIKVFKKETPKKELQEIYDFIFRQLELNIREIGYGDQSINKKMKDYLNVFHGILDKVHFWDDLDANSKKSLFLNFFEKSTNHVYLIEYFEKYQLELLNNSLNYYIKSVMKG